MSESCFYFLSKLYKMFLFSDYKLILPGAEKEKIFIVDIAVNVK